MMMTKQTIRWASIGLWLLAVTLFWAFLNARDLTVLAAIDLLIAWVRQSTWGGVGYVLFYIIQPIFFFPSTLLTIAAGYLFGPVWGIVLTVIGSNLSSIVAHSIGRYVGNSFISDERMGQTLGKYIPRLEKRPFETVLIMRMLYLPYDLTSYTLGALRIRLLPFALGTLVGSLAGTTSFVLFGASIQGDFAGQTPAFNPTTLLWAAGLFVISVSISRLIQWAESSHYRLVSR